MQRFGSVLAVTSDHSGAGPSTDAVVFYEATAGEVGDCKSHVGFPSPGQCVIETCAIDAPVHPRPAVGVVTFSSGPLSLAAAPHPDGNYPTASLAGALWNPGAMVDIEAAGGDVPTFNEALAGPVHIDLVNPPESFIDRTSGLSVVWDKTEAPLVAISVRTHSGPVLVCRFNGASGSAFVPPSMLAAVPQGAATLWIASISETSVQGGDFETYVGLRDEAFVGDVTVK